MRLACILEIEWVCLFQAVAMMMMKDALRNEKTGMLAGMATNGAFFASKVEYVVVTVVK